MSMAVSSSSSDNDTESSLLDKEVACEEKNAVPDDKVKKRGAKKRKRTHYQMYNRKIDSLKKHVLKLKRNLESFPALLIFKKKNEIHFVGDSDLEKAFGASEEAKRIIENALTGKPITSEKNLSTKRKRASNANEGVLNTIIDKPSLSKEELVIVGEALRNHLIHEMVSDWKSETLENSHHINANEVVAKTLLTKDAVASDDEDNEPPRSVERATDLKKKTEVASPNILPREQLRQLAIMSKKHLLAIADTRWESFLRKVSKIDKNFVERCKIFLSGHQDEFTMRTMPSSVSVIDELYNNLDIVPDGMQVLTATGNGDCLFNSVGKLLFGTEAVAPILRLVAVVGGIDHAEHFVNEYRDLYITRDSALQMLYVFSTAETYARRPSSSTATTATSILRFAIRSEIMELTFQRSFAGLLQIRLLGTSLYRNVNLHCSYSDFYHGLMSPCVCRQQLIERPLNVMFVGASKELKQPNHYVPLVWKI
eukprot:gene4266-4837_t